MLLQKRTIESHIVFKLVLEQLILIFIPAARLLI